MFYFPKMETVKKQVTSETRWCQTRLTWFFSEFPQPHLKMIDPLIAGDASQKVLLQKTIITS